MVRDIHSESFSEIDMLSPAEQIEQAKRNGEMRPLDMYPAPRLRPDLHPGEWPSDWSGYLVTKNDGILRLEMGETDELSPVLKSNGREVSLDSYLQNQGLAPLEERYPVIAYGTNRNPGQLIDKFTKIDKETDEDVFSPGMKIVPAFKATVKGVDVVYTGAPGNLGYFFSELYAGPETEDTEIDVSVLMLTWEQLQVIHASEKAYSFGEYKTLETKIPLGDSGRSQEVPAYVYVGETTVHTLPRGGQSKPVAIKEVPARGRELREENQDEMVRAFFADDPEGYKHRALVEVSGIPDILPTPENFRKYMSMKRAGGVSTLEQRRTFQARLKDAMRSSEHMEVDLRASGSFKEAPKSLPVLMSLAEIAIAHPRGQGWWKKLGERDSVQNI